MNLKKLLILFTYLLVATGLLIIYYSEEIPAIYWIIILGVFFLSLFLYPQWSKKHVTMFWNIAIVAIFFLFIFKGIMEGNWLILAIYFSIVMLLSKLFQRRNSRDYYQVFTLSFLQVIGGAVINPGLSFGILFFLYVVLFTLCLLLLHIWKEGADFSKIRISKKLLFSISFLSIFLFLTSLILFFFFPRLGLGFFKLKLREGVRISGFSSEVELGNFATIKEDSSIVMRIIIDNGKRIENDILRIKGISLDFFNAKGWEKTHKTRISLRVDNEGIYRVYEPRISKLDKEKLIKQEIYLEPIETELIPVFALVGILAIDKRSGVMELYPEGKFGVYRDLAGDIIFFGPRGRGILYTAFSDKEQSGIIKERFDEDFIKDTYLQLPEINKEIKFLAQRVTEGAKTNFKKAEKISEFLQNNYKYSLTDLESRDDPISDFLFKKKKGHCEYFSSSMTVMLRSIGVPARIVNGFYGGKWNEFGNYYAITADDAHSWVEVYDKGFWKTFDPTPPSFLKLREKKGIITTISKYIDSIKLKWYRWIIEYDLEKQVYIFSTIFDFLRGKSFKHEKYFNSVSISEINKIRKDVEKIPFVKIFLLFVFLLILMWIGKYLIKKIPEKRRKIMHSNKLVKIYRKFIKKLCSKGIKKDVSMTPDELLFVIKTKKFEDYEKIEKFIDYYQFGLYSKSPEINEIYFKLKKLYEEIRF